MNTVNNLILFIITKELGDFENHSCMKAQDLQWNDLYLIMAICREGTLSGAARTLDVNHSTVFRRIASIEEKLGVRLFERHSGGYAMTSAAEAVLTVAEKIENDVLGLSRELIGKDLQLNGVLRIATPDALLLKILLPHLKFFTVQYPEIQLELFVSNNYSNLTRREADVAIRVTDSPPESAMGRRICIVNTTIYASDEYLKNRASSEFNSDTWLMPDENLAHLPVIKWLDHNYSHAKVLLRTNNILALYESVLLGLGVAALPCFLADPNDRLTRLLEPPKELSSELWILSHPDLRRTARVRVLMKFLSNSLQKDKSLIEGCLVQ